MKLFRYASDYYGDSLAQQLLLPGAVLFSLLSVLLVAIHSLRRSAGQPRSTTKIPPGAYGGGPFERYESGARLYHWGNALFVGILSVSGYALFVPGSLKPTVITWLRIHEVFAAAFIGGVVFHAIVAPLRGEGRTMWFDRRDFSDIRTIVLNFLGATSEYPAFGKYDPFQKLYHASLAAMSTALMVTGIVLTFSTEAWVTFPRETLRWIRMVHDLAAAWFAAAVIGHVYFGLIRVNWPALGSIVRGTISGGYLRIYHTPERWMPKSPASGREGD
jgi:Ni/Fe-hydrogenase 1 B-type cytochrome subunit